MKTLIVYYSLEGTTKSAAESLAQLTGADLLGIHPVKEYPSSGAKKFMVGGKSALAGDKPKLQPYIFNCEKYDAVVLCSPVWASTFAPPMRTFIHENRDRLVQKKLFGLLGYKGGGGEKAMKKLVAYTLGKESQGFERELLLVDSDKNRAQKLVDFAAAIKGDSDD